MLRRQGFRPGEADRLALQAFPDVSYDELNPGHGISDFERIVGGIGDVVKFAAPAATLIPGVGPLVAAGVGAVGGLAGNLNDPDGFKGALGDVLLGGALGGFGGLGLEKAADAGLFGKLGSLGSGLGTALLGGAGSGDGEGGGGIPNWLKLLIGAGATGLALRDQSQQREAAEEFAREQLRLQARGLELAEQSFAERAPLREAAFNALLQRVQGGPDPTDIFGSFLQRRAAGLPAGFIGGPEPEEVQQRLQQQLPQRQQPQQQPTTAQKLAEAIKAARQPSPQQQLSSVVQAAAQNGSARQRLRDALIQALV